MLTVGHARCLRAALARRQPNAALVLATSLGGGAAADDGGRAGPDVLGYAVIEWRSLAGSVAKLVVAEHARRKGIGEAVLRASVEHLFGARRVMCINLHVDPARQPAVALYAKLGWRVDGAVKDYYAPGRDAHRMVLDSDVYEAKRA